MQRLVENDGRTPVTAQVLDLDGNLWPGTLVMMPGGMVRFVANAPQAQQVDSTTVNPISGQVDSIGRPIDGHGNPLADSPEALAQQASDAEAAALVAGQGELVTAGAADDRPAGKRPAGQRR